MVWLAAFLCTRLPVLQLLQANPWKRLLLLHKKFADNMATIAVATKGATHPATGMEIAHIAEGTMEVGMGQHGEGGGGTQPMNLLTKQLLIMMDALLKDLDVKARRKARWLLSTAAVQLL